jgi:hypothetical protein
VVFDWEQLRRGSDLNAFAETFAEGCITMFGDGFGHLTPFDEVDVRCSDAFPTPAALLILERQSMIYKVLYTVISCLTNSITITKGSAEWNTLASRRFRNREDIETVYQHIDGIFLSTIPDLGEISHIIVARKQYFEDELAFLSSEVDYFTCICAEFQEMQDTDPRPKREQPGEATVTAVILGSFQDLLCWHFLKSALDDLVKVMASCNDDLRCGQIRPTLYQESFSKVSTLTYQMLVKAVDDLRTFCNSSSLFVKHTRQIRRGQPCLYANSDPPWKVLGYKDEGDLYRTDPLLCSLALLCHDSRTIPLVLPSLHNILSKRNDAKRINVRMMHLIAEIGDLWRLFELYQYQRPAVAQSEQSFLVEDSCLTARYFAALRHGEIPVYMHRNGRLERQFEGLKVIRPGTRRDNAWQTAADKSQQQLNEGMHLAIGLFLAMLVQGGLRAIEDILHVESLLTLCKGKFSGSRMVEKYDASIPTPPQSIPVRQPYVPIPEEPEAAFKRSKVLPAGCVAKDTRPPRAVVQPHQPAIVRPVETYNIPRRSYRLVDHLFPTGRQPQGQVTFQDLGRLLAGIGFGRTGLGGSQYRFFRASNEASMVLSLVIHKRHPDPAYRAVDLRGIGRRLSSRFGWTAETFKLL